MKTVTKEQTKENNLLVLFGASDDLLEMRGAIYDEAGAWDGGAFFYNGGTGYIGTAYKFGEYSVRPVRTFEI